MDFKQVALTFNRMSETSKRLELTSLLAELFREADSDLSTLTYLVEGKLAPDFEGKETYLADKLIVKALSEITGIQERELERRQGRTGDLGTLAEEVLEKKLQQSLLAEKLTVSDLHSELMNISEASGHGSTGKRLKIFENLLLSGTPDEAKYITRIVTGRLRLGVSDATILAALAEAFEAKDSQQEIENAFNFHPDIGLIAELLQKRDIERIKGTSAEPLVPFKVMLAERLPSIGEILDKMGGKASFEYKYDGLRVQIHKKGDEIKIYSRRSEEITQQFPDIVKNTRDAFNCKSCILDGEAVPVNLETGEIYPFQVVSQRRGRKYDLEKMAEEIPIVVFLFDVLYYNDKFFGNLPYEERRKKLENVYKEKPGFRLASRIVSADVEEITKFFDQSISDGCEGIVAKNVSEQSIYRAGARGWLWIKFKRDYQAELADTLDLVVVGAFHGSGRRKGTYGALLMAVYDKEMDQFETICKLGTGFTDDILRKIHSELQESISREKPNNLSSRIVPDVWIYPSMVLEISGAEITLSPVHTCRFNEYAKDVGLSLRFPRFTGNFRTDRSPEESTDSIEVKEMFERQKKRSGLQSDSI